MSKSKLPETVFDLIPDPENANRGTERGSGLLENMLRTHGFIGAIALDADNKVIAGNKTLQAAIDAGIVRVRVVETDGNEVIATKRPNVKLDSKIGRELADGHNRIGQISLEWDPKILIDQGEKYGLNLDACGFSEGELAELLRDAEAEAEADIKLKDVDTRPPPAMSWVLIGIPTTQFGSIAPHVEAIAKISGTIIESTVTSEVPDAEDKPQDGQREPAGQAGAASSLPE